MDTFKVISNVKHNGTEYKQGTIINGEINEFQQLINDGLFVVYSEEEQIEENTEEAEEEIEPENTWGPKKDEEVPGEVEEPALEEIDEDEPEEGEIF